MNASSAKSWPFEQAKLVLARVGPNPTRPVVFQTGFGPSGAPHIGTFGEIVRTNMVRNAYVTLTTELYGTPHETILQIVSDDYDALRRVPDGLEEDLSDYIGLPLTKVPFHGTSFGKHNTELLRDFCLDVLGINPLIISATYYYQRGIYNDALVAVAREYDNIMQIILPTLGISGSNRKETYSPFLPISKINGSVLQVPVELEWEDDVPYAIFEDIDGSKVRTTIIDGNVKLQWKIDWAMRWHALKVDYEMCGKDLIDSLKISNKIVRLLGSEPPVNMTYELFLDENGEKISKSKGNGFPLEEWLKYGDVNSLKLFMFQSPKSAKKLYAEVIPRITDEYLKFLSTYSATGISLGYDNPAWHIHDGNPPMWTSDVNYTLLLNLTSVSNATDESLLKEYLSSYRQISKDNLVAIEKMLPYVLSYYKDFAQAKKNVRPPTDVERNAIHDLIASLRKLDSNLGGEAYQFVFYEWGKRWVASNPNDFSGLKDMFGFLYAVYFGSESGPRLGTFMAAYGKNRTIELFANI